MNDRCSLKMIIQKANSIGEKKTDSPLSLGIYCWLLTSFCLIIWGLYLKPSDRFNLIGLQPAFGQVLKPQDISGQVYQLLPNLPLENQYISKETGKVASANTLVTRLISYHQYVKSRTPNYRLDWKLTLADYLGANDNIAENLYPGSESLRQNPMSGDRAAISRLNRSEREALIITLVSIFNPNYQQLSTPEPTPSRSPVQSPASPRQPRIMLPKPGDAQLLKL